MGRPVVHWELMSKAPAGVAAFYEKLFGWEIDYVREIDYRIVNTGAESGINGGIVSRAERWSKRAAASASRSRKCPAWALSPSSPIRRAA